MTVKKVLLDDDKGQDIPEVSVKPPEEKKPPTFKEQLENFVPKTRSRSKRAPKKQIDKNIFSKLVPTLVATFVATYTRQLIQDPYKVCAPSQQEVMTIITPLFNIVSRYVEITGQASETVIDLINSVIASVIFGTRAYVTYAMIKENEKHGQTNSNVNGVGNADAEFKADTNRGTRRDSQKSNGVTGTTEQFGSNGPNVVTIDRTTTSDDIQREISLFSSLFSKDIEGRIRLGYLPPRIPESNE